MKKLWLPALLALLFGASCTPDRTLDSLIPRDALAVVLVDHPSWVAQTWGTEGNFPWKALEASKPWAAAVLPSNPPGFLLALALADTPTAWSDLRRWAQEQGGLVASRLGSYALLTTPGTPEATVLDVDRRFDLSRVRAGGDPVSVYFELSSLTARTQLPQALKSTAALLPWASSNLNGLRLGLGPKDGGFELRVATDWKVGAEAAKPFQSWSVPVDPSTWSGLLPSDGLGVVASLPEAAWRGLLPLDEPRLAQRWAALAPLLGPRLAFAAQPQADGTWSWSLALESKDPQAVRQALRTLVASGDVQRSFPQWAVDADTALIYRDLRSGTPGARATLHFGSGEWQIAYGTDRVVWAAGTDAEALTRWSTTPPPAPWVGQAPPQTSALATGYVDGLGAKAAFRVLPDGNLELRTWIDKEGVRTWEERLPQALLGWLAGEGGLTILEP